MLLRAEYPETYEVVWHQAGETAEARASQRSAPTIEEPTVMWGQRRGSPLAQRVLELLEDSGRPLTRFEIARELGSTATAIRPSMELLRRKRWIKAVETWHCNPNQPQRYAVVHHVQRAHVKAGVPPENRILETSILSQPVRPLIHLCEVSA